MSRAGKLVILGGSSQHTPAFFRAAARSTASTWDEVCLVGPSAERVERAGRACQALAEQLGLSARVTWDTDVARAASGATYVLNMLRVGGDAAVDQDRRLLAASGVVGHAASYPEAIRHVTPTLAAARAVERVAPRAVFVNFTNPVSIVCEAIAEDVALTCFGICHHAFSMRADFARLLNAAPDRVRVEYQGLNHLGWVTDVQVDGATCMASVIDRLVRQRVKAYEYRQAPLFNAIPIKHAGALYHRGEVLYVRQYGARSSLVDVGLRYGLAAPFERFLRTRPTPAPTADPPWYASCIVPFLDALVDGHPRELIVTSRQAGFEPVVAGHTAETTVILEGGLVGSAPGRSTLPAVAQEWLRQVRESERLLLGAIRHRSAPMLVESLAVHPSVASVAHARRLVERLQRSTLFIADV